jgi:putative transposase
MPYEYRTLTPTERKEVLRWRRERGYPLHSPPHPFRQVGWYMLTAANFAHATIMAAPDRRTAFEARLLIALCDVDVEVFGWAILPNHYHVLVGIVSLDQVSVVLKQLHGTTSREWNLADSQTGKRRVGYKFMDRAIRNEEDFYRALNYIHTNPVKHQYVDDPYAWPWSSIHSHAEIYGRQWLRDKWKSHPPSNFGKGWDD